MCLIMDFNCLIEQVIETLENPITVLMASRVLYYIRELS